MLIPWNKGNIVGRKPPLKASEVWAIRVRLELAGEIRDLALFNLVIDSKLRGCDLVRLRLPDVMQGGAVAARATILQQKTHEPVQFEITQRTREALVAWIEHARPDDYLFPGQRASHLSTRQYARRLQKWVNSIGLDPALYSTHSLRRTKATMIYRRTRNLRAVQLLLGHTKLESNVLPVE